LAGLYIKAKDKDNVKLNKDNKGDNNSFGFKPLAKSATGFIIMA
jgi:hypothetical protein